MRILHVYDIAGVACTIAKYQRQLGHQVWVVGRGGQLDPVHFLDFYKDVIYHGDDFLDFCKSVASSVDIVHIHALPEHVKDFKDLGKKVVLHYHGNDVIKIQVGKPDAVILSTDNLLKYRQGEYVPNPIDTDHFTRTHNDPAGEALTFQMRYNDIEKMKEYYGKPVKIIDRDNNPIPYKDMPFLLSNYKTYVDIKFDVIFEHDLLRAISKTGLEALACGLSVVNWELKTITGLPEENKPLNVVKRIDSIYETIH